MCIFTGTCPTTHITCYYTACTIAAAVSEMEFYQYYHVSGQFDSVPQITDISLKTTIPSIR